MTDQALQLLDNQVLIRSIKDLLEVSTILVKSGLLPKVIDTPEKASVIILKGRELGIPMMASFALINVIDRVPTVSPQGMLALINSRGVAEDMTVQGDDKSCTVMMKRKGREPHTEMFTWEQASKMMTVEWKDNQKIQIPLTQKYNWKQMPKFMLQWRCVAACARIVYSDIVAGLYPPEEIDPGLVVDESGEVVEGQVVESQRHAPVDQEMQQAQARQASEQAERVREGPVQAGMEFQQGVLTYKHVDGKAHVLVNGTWKEAGKEVGSLTDKALSRFTALFLDKDGKPNKYEMTNHLKKHHKVGTVQALTWERAAALFELKEHKNPDPHFYPEEYKGKQLETGTPLTEPLDAVAQGIAQIFELPVEQTADTLEFIGALRSLKDVEDVARVASAFRSANLTWATHPNEMRALANLLAEGTVELDSKEFVQMLSSLDQAHAETAVS